MKHVLDPVQRLLQDSVRTQVPGDELDPVQHFLQVFQPAGGQVVEHAHLLAAPQQFARNCRPDESGPSRYQVTSHGMLLY